jgi:hypothetical protein
MGQTFDVMIGGSGGGFFEVMVVLWGLFLTIFWMVCGWRAMRAHEKLVESVDELLRKQQKP